MMELTKERLQEALNLRAEHKLSAIEAFRLHKILFHLLSGMEREPVYQACKEAGVWVDIEPGDAPSLRANGEQVRALYAAPQLQQPAVVSFDEWSRKCDLQIELCDRDFRDKAQYIWNACRAAMLQGAEPVSQPYTLPAGMVAVPLEPTENMIIAGFEAELREEFRDPEAWETFEAMSGCEQAAHRAKWCWAAMIAAAPQQGTK